jgi:hypothetical protein
VNLARTVDSPALGEAYAGINFDLCEGSFLTHTFWNNAMRRFLRGFSGVRWACSIGLLKHRSHDRSILSCSERVSPTSLLYQPFGNSYFLSRKALWIGNDKRASEKLSELNLFQQPICLTRVITSFVVEKANPFGFRVDLWLHQSTK